MENFIFDDDDLIWYIDPNDVYRRLYVSKSLETDIFVMIHDNYVYTDFYRVYDRVRFVFYFYRFYRRLRMYVTHYL